MSKNTGSDESQKKNNRERRRKTDNKRKKSGLLEKRIYLQEDTIQKVTAIAEGLGYPLANGKLSNEDLSTVILYLVEANKCDNDVIAMTYQSIQLKWLHQIAKYRSSMGDTIEEIADFFRESKYNLDKSTIRSLLRSKMILKCDSNWSTRALKKLLKDAAVNRVIKKINRDSGYDYDELDFSEFK